MIKQSLKLFFAFCFILQIMGCGVYTLSLYRIKHNEEYTEKALINLQHTHPEIRVPEIEQDIFLEFNHTVPMPNVKLNASKAHAFNSDTIKKYYSSNPKDYYYHWNGQKIFIYSIDNGNIFYELRILDAGIWKCKVGVTRIGIKAKDGSRKWYSHQSMPVATKDSTLKIFESKILPKLKEVIK